MVITKSMDMLGVKSEMDEDLEELMAAHSHEPFEHIIEPPPPPQHMYHEQHETTHLDGPFQQAEFFLQNENQNFADKFMNLDSPKALLVEFPPQATPNYTNVPPGGAEQGDVHARQHPLATPSSSLNASNISSASSGPNSNFGPTIALVEGFSRAVQEEQPGGSSNKVALPLQVVEMVHLPPQMKVLMENARGPLFTVQVFFVGYDNHGEKKVLTEKPICESSFIEVSPGVFRAMFSNIVCTYTSHHCGKSLCLRFVLVQIENNQILESIDSFEFKTLTQRAWQKRKEKIRCSEASILASQHGDKSKGKLLTCTPQIGPCQGGQLVKISGLGFNTTVNRVVVKFGEKTCRHVYSVSKNTIICETPDNNAGTVEVKVALDGKMNFIESRVSYMYIRPSDINGVFKYVQHVLGTDHRFMHKM